MKISTKLFNQQQVSTFSKLTENIQNLQSKISSGKNFVSASDDPVAAAELSGLNTVKERFNQYSENAISIPIYPDLNFNTQKKVINLLKRFFKKNK